MKNNRYNEYVLGGKVDDYIVNLFQEGGKTLARAVLAEINLAKMYKTTFLPENIQKNIIEDYNSGGIASASMTENWLAQKIQNFLSSDENNTVFFEHALAKKNDPWLQESQVQAVFYNDEVYFPLFSNQVTDIECIKETKNAAETAWLLLGFMTSVPNSCLMITDAINLDAIQNLAQSTEHIITSAYDGEGYIICSKIKEAQRTDVVSDL